MGDFWTTRTITAVAILTLVFGLPFQGTTAEIAGQAFGGFIVATVAVYGVSAVLNWKRERNSSDRRTVTQ